MTIAVTAHARRGQRASQSCRGPTTRLVRRRARQRGRAPVPAPYQSTLSPSTASRWASLPTSLHPLMAGRADADARWQATPIPGWSP